MKIAIIGASGYAGGELIRLLAYHSTAEVTCATSRKLAGTPLDQIHPHLKGFTDLTFTNPETDAIDADVAFLAVPHTAAMTYAGKLLSRGIKVVDLSADYRLPKDVYEKVYGVTHSDYFPAPYGIPELHRKECINAKFVANPGCFPTGATLAAAPLAKYAHTVIFDSKTGVSGAGDNPSATTHYPNVGDNVGPYKLTTHRHLAEMKQELAFLGVEGKGLLHPAPCPGQPGHPDNGAYPAQRAHGAEGGGEALPRLLQGRVLRAVPEAHPRRCPREQLLRPHGRERRTACRSNISDRQPCQGCQRPGNPEHEPDVRLEGE